MAGPLEKKTVLITGCTPGGIGHALCQEFHNRGLHVIATARRSSVLTDLVELGMSTVELDVTNPVSIENCHKTVQEITGGHLDILINNAGRTHVHPALDLSIPDVRQTFETNVFGTMAMISAFSDFLIAAKGLVINIASLAAVLPYTFGSAYCASKGAIVSYSRTLRQELEPLGVKVMVCMVGTVQSNIQNREHRSLPPNSEYIPVNAVFQKRLTFINHSNPCDTVSFSKALAASALSYEVPWLFRSWVGRPDWFWYGGLARRTWWWTSFLGEWWTDLACSLAFNLSTLSKIKKVD